MKKKIFILISVLGSLLITLTVVEVFFIANSKYHFFNKSSVKYDLTKNQTYFKNIPQKIIDELNNTYKDYPELETALAEKLNAMTPQNLRTFVPTSPSSYIKNNPKSNTALSIQDKSYNEKLDRVIFDVTYNMTADGYRSVPGQIISNKNKNILLVGCSLTFGTGVNDNETIAYFLKKSLPQYNIINLGIPSGGLNDMIDDILINERYKKINSNGGAVIYSFIPHHIERTLCNIECYRKDFQWIQEKNNYQWDHSDNLVNLGTFKDSRSKLHKTLRSLVAKSETLNFLSFKNSLVPDYNEQLLFAKYLGYLSSEYKKKNLEFYFFTFYPEYLDETFYESLNKYEVRNISRSLRTLPEELQNKIKIHGDGHYTSIGNHLISMLFFDSLK